MIVNSSFKTMSKVEIQKEVPQATDIDISTIKRRVLDHMMNSNPLSPEVWEAKFLAAQSLEGIETE